MWNVRTMMRESHAFRIRLARVPDIPVLARHRVMMFADMGKLAASQADSLERATASYLHQAMPRGEYLGWVADAAAAPIGGAGVQLRPILPRPDSGEAIELGPEAIILNVYVEREWRRRGVAEAMMRTALETLAARGIRRIVLHASDDGRRLYERLGFVPTNEMRLQIRSHDLN
jgi:GNAT superfamily N-acetyltransferase